MSDKAFDDVLNSLHQGLAEHLLKLVETNVISASEITAAINLLKHNNHQVDLVKNPAMKALSERLAAYDADQAH